MKRIKFTVFLTFILLLCLAFAVSANAEEPPEEYSDFFGSLPDDIKDTLPENVGNDPAADAESITSWDFLLSAAGSGFLDGLKRIIPTFCALLGLILISSVISAFKSSIEPKTANVLDICGSSAISAAFVALHLGTVQAVAKYLSDLLTLVNTITPVTAFLYASGGNVSGAAVGTAGMSVFMGFCENVLAKTVIPFSGVYLSLITVSSVAPGIGLDSISELIKSTYTKTVAFLMSIFCAILAAQTAIASASDSVSLRAAKFITGSTIPIVGGSVNESMKTLAGSIGLLKKCFGICGIIILAMLTLPVITTLLLSRFSLNLAASAADLLHCAPEKKLLKAISGVYGMLIAVVSAASLMFVFLLTLFTLSATALSGA